MIDTNPEKRYEALLLPPLANFIWNYYSYYSYSYYYYFMFCCCFILFAFYFCFQVLLLLLLVLFSLLLVRLRFVRAVDIFVEVFRSARAVLNWSNFSKLQKLFVVGIV